MFAAALTALYLVLAVTWSGWWLAAAAFFAALPLFARHETRRLRRRLDHLIGPGPDA